MERPALFDSKSWSKIVLERPDWYEVIYPEYRRLEEVLRRGDPKTAAAVKGHVNTFFESKLRDRRILMGAKGRNWDSERRPIDTFVLHHTSSRPGITWRRLSAIQLLRVYAAFYASPAAEREGVRGQAIWSGHFRDDEQVFYGYHYLVRQNGRWEPLLDQEEIGWHAGNWTVNRRSIAICLDGDFEHARPSQSMVKAAAYIMKYEFPDVHRPRITGHREVKLGITCPGDYFLGPKGWKQDLLDAYRAT